MWRKALLVLVPEVSPLFGEDGADFCFKIQFEIKKTIDSSGWPSG
jgi:hypothetical protein